MVALTFDDGPMASVGNRIMDCLAQYGGKATFYVVGNRCPGYAAEMQRMAAEGHEIGNHTYEHKYLHKLGAEQIQYQVNKGSEAIQAVCGVVPATVRLPGGNKNATVLANVNAPMIMWSIDTLDWKTKNTQSTVDKVLGSVRDGDIVLMHELYSQTGDAALQIISAGDGQRDGSVQRRPGERKALLLFPAVEGIHKEENEAQDTASTTDHRRSGIFYSIGKCVL